MGAVVQHVPVPGDAGAALEVLDSVEVYGRGNGNLLVEEFAQEGMGQARAQQNVRIEQGIGPQDHQLALRLGLGAVLYVADASGRAAGGFHTLDRRLQHQRNARVGVEMAHFVEDRKLSVYGTQMAHSAGATGGPLGRGQARPGRGLVKKELWIGFFK